MAAAKFRVGDIVRFIGTDQHLFLLHLRPSCFLSCCDPCSSFRAHRAALPSGGSLFAWREPALQRWGVTSQQGSKSLKTVNLIVDALDNNVEVHSVNVG